MRFTLRTPDVTTLEDTFYCRGRRKELTLERCLDDFVDANALGRKGSACFRCPLGRANRQRYASCEEKAA